MSTQRATLVAEILWELKRADRFATLTSIARRAGFSPGAQCRTILACMNTIQKEWPHLEWWRALHDDGVVEKKSVQAEAMERLGIELREDGAHLTVILDVARMMAWDTTMDGKAIKGKAAAVVEPLKTE
ncbi:MAG: hypothetical protein DWH91_01245 [Planctomycetota bacterium]|nr:MAG: hypothetical protein DWH91_01245 [Planctomycetota bacterium]